VPSQLVVACSSCGALYGCALLLQKRLGPARCAVVCRDVLCCVQVVFNPKDTNTFASASLDRTVKVGTRAAIALACRAGQGRAENVFWSHM
jgi:hypothetical protein